MTRTTWIATPLVFVSGACALIYQIVWTRELRLVFGASTAASSAVIAIFIAGLGLGGLYWGRRVERSARPLAVYAGLEIAVALAAALSPLLLWLVRSAYLASGGSLSLGGAGASAVRLLLSTLVLGPATWLMGGTLPAIARAVEFERDSSRRAVALVYGVNTLGALLGCWLSTFVMLEALGTRNTLFYACTANVLIALAGLVAARLIPAIESAPVQPTAADVEAAAAPASTGVAAGWVYASAALVGFAFFLMELVFYRVLAPLLGGTIFTFGLILAIALAGIGLGSALYAVSLAGRRVSLIGFAFTCALEALCLAIPYALGDQLAIWAALLRPLGQMGFNGLIAGWVAIAGCVVFPAALVSGFQFPLLIALLGSGRTHVARDVGRAYAANTLGAVIGALAGGFGLMSIMGALGCWRLVCGLLAGWGVVLAGMQLLRRQTGPGSLWVLTSAVLTLVCVLEQGPTSVFRHSPIGAGRIDAAALDSPTTILGYMRRQRQSIIWQTDGVESAIGLARQDGLSFIVNGKSDGHARNDAATQVMGALVGAALRPKIRNAMVIGLGTGSTAGWLAQLPEIERVDVAEIEPAILNVASACAPVNLDVLNNPKVHILRGDARELLSVSRQRYDLIFSEPSNPYRAGVSSLYTREFYEAVTKRLEPDGVFVQWLQAYEIDTKSVHTVYATLGSAFPHVETWNGMHHDLLLVAGRKPWVHDPAQLKARVESEPFASAMRVSWTTHGLEGFLSHYVADAKFTQACVRSAKQLNTDDHSPVEFGFARSLRSAHLRTADLLFSEVRKREEHRPNVGGQTIDWERVDFEREASVQVSGGVSNAELLAPTYRLRMAVLQKWMQSDYNGALTLWNSLTSQKPIEPIMVERLALGELIAYQGDDTSEPWIDRVLTDRPTEQMAMKALWSQNHNRPDEATDRIVQAMELYRTDPWPLMALMARTMHNMVIARPGDKVFMERYAEALSQPFSVYVNDTTRQQTFMNASIPLGPDHASCLRVLKDLEPNVPWQEPALDYRLKCYEAHRDPLRTQAAADLQFFRRSNPLTFETLLKD